MEEMISKDAVMTILHHNWGKPKGYTQSMEEISKLPPVQPERLTDDDFKTIRIHLNAYKEKLCNQQRWEEAEEYQRIIDRFMAFASAQPNHNADVSKKEIVHCKDCKFAHMTVGGECKYCDIWFPDEKTYMPGDYYCGSAEKRGEQDGTD